MSQFEIYTPKRGRRSGAPAIRFSSTQKRIALTRSARELLPKACQAVLLAFNRETRQVALIACNPQDPKAVRITKTGTVSAGDFQKDYDIPDGSFVVEKTMMKDLGAILTGGIVEAQS